MQFPTLTLNMLFLCSIIAQLLMLFIIFADYNNYIDKKQVNQLIIICLTLISISLILTLVYIGLSIIQTLTSGW